MPRSKPRPRRDPGSGSVFERTRTTRQGKTYTVFVAELPLPDGPRGRRRKTIYSRSRQEVIEKLAQARREYDRAGNLPTSDPTVKQWCDLWLTEFGPKLKPSVLPSYRSKIETWIKPVLGRHKLSRLEPEHVRSLHKQMRDAGAKPNHVLAVHRVLSSVLADAVEWGRATRNVAKIARAGGAKRGDRRALTVEQAVAVMVAGAEHDPLGTRWPFAFLTGHRQGERLGLRWSALDLDAGTADVSWALAAIGWAHGCNNTCGYKHARVCPSRYLPIDDSHEHIPLDSNLILQRPKSDTSRRLTPLPGFLVDALRRRYEQVLAERPGYTVDHDLVWCHPDGRPIRPDDDWQTWKDICRLAGLEEDFTQHEIRHTTVSLLAELGVDPRVITEIAGHSDMLTTAAYKHVRLDVARAALDSLGSVLALPVMSTST